MSEFLEFLNKYVAAFNLIFTAVVTLSTVVYAILTALLVKETKKMREVQTEPKIHITLESFDFAVNIVRLNIKNIGLGLASKLEFKTSVLEGGASCENLLKEFTSSNFFKTGIRYFGPGQNVYSAYTQLTHDFEGKAASVILIQVSYQGSSEKKYHEEIVIDMSEIRGMYQLGTPNLYSIAKSLEKMQQDVAHIVSGFKRIKADVYTSEDRAIESEERNRWYEEQNRESS